VGYLAGENGLLNFWQVKPFLPAPDSSYRPWKPFGFAVTHYKIRNILAK
jgi:hypothetical protein